MSDRNGKLERTTFEFTRAGEYFDLRELQTMTGQPAQRFAEVVLKELLDNAADAAEKAGVTPKISVCLKRLRQVTYLLIRDNGAGLDPDTLGKILNFQTRTSDKSAYRSPTRGALGNAWKTVLGIPEALGVHAPVYVEAHGVRHRVRARLDPAGEVQVRHDKTKVPPKPGTLVAVPLPADLCDRTPFCHWARAFSLVNPHAAVRILNSGAARQPANKRRRKTRNSYRPTVAFPGEWRKFLPGDFTSPWWYDTAALGKLVFAHAAAARKGERDLLLREFIRQFRGLSGTAKAKAVCDQFCGVERLSDFADRQQDVTRLLGAMRNETQAPSPGVLGEVGPDHFRAKFDRWFGGVKRFWYKKVAGVADGVCYTVEVALAQTREPGRQFYAVNYSPAFDDPLAGTYLQVPEFGTYGVGGFLQRAHAGRAAAAFHLVCPVVETLDKGKTRLKVPREVAEAAAKALWSVSKDLYREGERRLKDAARQEKADREQERQARPKESSLKDAVFRVMAQAVRDAAGTLGIVSAHTLFYHVRPLVQQYTSRPLESDYFEQKLLPCYRREVGPLKEVYYEPRGVLYEPHTGRAVPLGTREVEEYQFPAWLYDKVLFVEKKGLWPVFQAARLAERYDMAIVAGEGYATEACRVLFAHAEQGKRYQLFVLHDADPFGYNIARTLREETARMPGYHVEVVDLGLKLGDALDMGLATENFTRKRQLPQGLTLTALEREYFEGRRAGPRSWVCRRVEINAFANPALIRYTEDRLEAAGVRGKVIPPAEVLSQRLRGGVQQLLHEQVRREHEDLIHQEVRERFDELRRKVEARERGLARAVRRVLKEDRSRSWSGAVFDQARALVRDTQGDGTA
jgi:DNA topoisomerase VI subunit B